MSVLDSFLGRKPKRATKAYRSSSTRATSAPKTTTRSRKRKPGTKPTLRKGRGTKRKVTK